MFKRAVVTGMGPVSSIGIGIESFWKNAKEGRGYFRTLSFEGVDMGQYRSRVCSPIDDFQPGQYTDRLKEMKRAGKATKYSVIGAMLALQDAGFKICSAKEGKEGDPKIYYVEGIDPYRTGVILGQAAQNVDLQFADHVKFLEDRGPKRVNPFTLAQSNINTGVTSVAQWFYIRGTGHTIATACSSATHAISVGALHIQCGIEDIMIVGGAEGSIDKYMFSGFDRMRAMSARNDDPMSACRPFDRDRDGFVMGEGAGILVLEELEHARKRGVHIYGEIVGYGYSQDAYKLAAPDPYGTSAIHAIKKALSMAGITAQEVEYINAHGTSTPLNDSTESFIIKQVFGDYAYRIPVSSSKSYFGHAIGAAGGLEAIATLLMMDNGIIAPTANLETPDLDYIDQAVPELDKRCDLDYVPGVKREKQVNIALSESFGFGGQNGAIIFKRLEE